MQVQGSGSCSKLKAPVSHPKNKAFAKRCVSALIAVTAALGTSAAIAATPSASGVNQTGDDNSARISQQPEGAALYGFVVQQGQSNSALVTQVGPAETAITADVWQSGSSNAAETEQSNIENFSLISVQQHGNDNLATSLQQDSVQARGFIVQSGELNIADLYQAHMNATASIDQNGIANNASVQQTGDYLYHQNAFVYQQGDNNLTQAVQSGIGGNVLSSHQIGSGNYAEVSQWQSGEVSVGDSEVMMVVEGNENQVFVEQDNNQDGSFVLTQSGNFNHIIVYQSGEAMSTVMTSVYSSGNADAIDQVGSASDVEISRFNTNNSQILVNQEGYNDSIFVEQGYSEVASATINQYSTINSSISVRQVDTNSTQANVEQAATLSTVNVAQTGGVYSSSAQVRQYYAGEGGPAELIASIYQMDGTDVSSAEIQQTGLNGEALIEQVAVRESSALIMQDAIDSYAEIQQVGGQGNSARIDQTGEAYSASIYQSGNYNDASITQL
jgi:minor curlin subunit